MPRHGTQAEEYRHRYTFLTVENLKTNHKYEFRVSALSENVHGTSEPCEPTAPVFLKEGKRRGYQVYETGKKIRGKGSGPLDNYDSYVSDPWDNYCPKPVTIKENESVYDNYEILEEIGVGAFGVVHRCVEKSTGNVFAAKFVNTPHAADKETVRNEIGIMNSLRNRRLINLHTKTLTKSL